MDGSFVMGRKYNEILLEALKENACDLEVHGVKILVKPVPEVAEDSDVNPHVCTNP